MTQKRGWSLVAPLALVVGIAGCSGGTTVGDESPSEATNVDSNAEVADSNAEHGGRHGPERMVRQAISELGLSAAQKTAVDQALDGAFSGKESHEAVAKPFFGLLAKQVRAGAIDETALRATLEGAGADREEHRAKVVAAFQKIHDTLTSEQRAALVTKLEQTFAQHGGRERGEHKGKHGGMHGPLGFMLRDLDLDDAQREKIKSALDDAGLSRHGDESSTEHADMQAKMQAALEAFKLDRFDASTIVPDRPDGPKHLEKLTKAMSVVVPLLNASQREALATKIEEGPKQFHKTGGHAQPDDDEAE